MNENKVYVYSLAWPCLSSNFTVKKLTVVGGCTWNVTMTSILLSTYILITSKLN